MQFLLDLAALIFWLLVVVFVVAILPRSWRCWVVRRVVRCAKKIRASVADAKEDARHEKDGTTEAQVFKIKRKAE